MRDIQPKKKPKANPFPPQDLPEEPKELYSQQAEQPTPEKPLNKPVDNTPRFAGSKVPVANVHAPKQKPSVRHIPVQKERVAPAKPVQPKKKAPLFVQPSKQKIKQSPISHETPPAKVRLGHKERKFVAVFLLLVLAAVGLAAVIFLPKADITLILQTAPLLVDQELTLAQNASGATSDTLPANIFSREVRVENSSPVATTEMIGTKARGTVRIVNRTIETQPIREQSRLVTEDGQLFYMQRHAIVPPSSSVTVEVEADEPGEEGNLTSGRLNFAALDASAQSVVYAEVASPFSGGSGEETLVVAKADLDEARKSAAAAARQQVESSIRAELPAEWTLLEESWDGAIEEFETSAQEGDQIDSINYSALVTLRVMAFQEGLLEDQLKTALDERLDENFMLFPGPISFTKTIDTIDWEKEEGVMNVRVTHTTIPDFSLETLRDKLAGRTTEEVQTYLGGLRGVQSASVELWPFWVSKIPRIDKRISIDIISDRQP